MLDTRKPGVLGLCDKRGAPKTSNDERFYSIAVRCLCTLPECDCNQVPHVEVIAYECTFEQAKQIANQGALCLECGG